MDPDRGHLSLSIPTSQTQPSSQSSQQSQQQQQQQQQSQQGQSQAQPSDINSEAQEGSPVSVKRGPGRPKGSTKKLFEPDPSSTPKIKRPVGRPRKDGRPAGSVPKIPRAPGRPRKNFPTEFPVRYVIPASFHHRNYFIYLILFLLLSSIGLGFRKCK